MFLLKVFIRLYCFEVHFVVGLFWMFFLHVILCFCIASFSFILSFVWSKIFPWKSFESLICFRASRWYLSFKVAKNALSIESTGFMLSGVWLFANCLKVFSLLFSKQPIKISLVNLRRTKAIRVNDRKRLKEAIKNKKYNDYNWNNLVKSEEVLGVFSNLINI